MKSNNIGVGDQGSTGAGQAAANCGRRPDADPASCGRRPDADSLRRDLLLYAVTDRHWLHGETLYSQVEKALGGGATFVQLREKELDYDDFLAEAKDLQRLCRSHKVPFVINDNVDIALAMETTKISFGNKGGLLFAFLNVLQLVGWTAIMFRVVNFSPRAKCNWMTVSI